MAGVTRCDRHAVGYERDNAVRLIDGEVNEDAPVEVKCDEAAVELCRREMRHPVRADNLIQAVDQDVLSGGSLGNRRSQPLPARLTAPPHFNGESSGMLNGDSFWGDVDMEADAQT